MDSDPTTRLRLPGVDRRSPDSSAIRLAVHDGGVDRFHTELAGRCSAGRSFDAHAAGSGPDPRTSHHGTLCAILAAGATAGVAPAAQVFPVRYTGTSLAGWRASLACAVENADVVLCPWAMSSRSAVAVALAADFERWTREAVIVAPAGNDPRRVGFPACLPGVLGVGASISNRPASSSGSGEGVDVYAPVQPLPLVRIAGEDRSIGGTSAASALAAGIAVLLRGRAPELSPPEVLDVLRRSARSAAGCALLDFGRALDLLGTSRVTP